MSSRYTFPLWAWLGVVYINVLNDDMWYSDLIYALNGGRLYTSGGEWYIRADEFIEYGKYIGLENGQPNEKFEIVNKNE